MWWQPLRECLTGRPTKAHHASRGIHQHEEVVSTAETAVRPWTRPYDWAEVVLGVVAVLSFLWTDTSNAAMWTMIILGALVAIDGVVSLAMPGLVYGEGIQIVLGVLMFI